MDIEQLKIKSAEALVGLIDGVKEAKDFVIAEIPDILRQLITYNTIYHGLLSLLGFVLLGFAYWNLRKSRNHFMLRVTNETTGCEAHGAYGVFRALIAAFLLYCGSVYLSEHLFEFIKLLVAPKIWLIEYGAHLVKEIKG